MKKYDLLHEIFYHAGTEKFITLYDLEIKTGLSGMQLRSLLEDLKDEILIVEHHEGFQVSESGFHFCKRRWV
jgi:predicted TPR repeat methyltransferase